MSGNPFSSSGLSPQTRPMRPQQPQQGVPPMQQQQQMMQQQQRMQQQQQSYGQPQQQPNLRPNSMGGMPVRSPMMGVGSPQQYQQQQQMSNAAAFQQQQQQQMLRQSSMMMQQQQQQLQQQQHHQGQQDFQSMTSSGVESGAAVVASEQTSNDGNQNSPDGSNKSLPSANAPSASSYTPPPPPPASTTPSSSQSKEINTATVCRIGQETVQEIVGRIQEVFSYLKSLQPPVGAQNQDRTTIEKQQRLMEVLKGITQLFKRLHVCWDKSQEHTSGMEYTNIELLIPFKDDITLLGGRDLRTELEKKRGEAYRVAVDEHTEVMHQLTLKNRQLKEIIDQMRNIIWEINTMLAMRQT